VGNLSVHREGRYAVRPTAEDVLAARLRHAREGRSWGPVILGLVATIGERVEPAAPATGTSARDRWEERRKGEELRKVDVVRVLRRGRCTMGEAGTARERREERDRRIRELDRRGESIATIARVVGCSRVTVSRALGRSQRPR
jgi:Bacterial regulatory proteins, crp family